MRNFTPSEIPREFDSRLVKILKDLGGYLEQVDKGFARIQRGEIPVSGGAILPIPISHPSLTNLTIGDDHPMYLFLGTSSALRSGKASTATTDETDANKQIIYGNVSFRAADSGVAMQEFKSSNALGTLDGFSIKKTGGYRIFFFHPGLTPGDIVVRFPITFTASDILVLEATTNTLSKKTLTTNNILTFDGTATYCQLQNAGGASVYLDITAITAEKTLIFKNWGGTVPAPVGTGTSGNLLVSQGTSQPIWQAPSTAVAHSLLSATHTDTTPASVVRGDLITGQGASPAWGRLAVGTALYILESDGTDAVWADLFGAGHTWSQTNVFTVDGGVTIANNKSLNFKNDSGTGINILTVDASNDLRIRIPATGRTIFITNGASATPIFNISDLGTLTLGSATVGTHFLTFQAGTTTQAPIIFGSGSVVLSSATAGCLEYNGTNLFITTSAPARKTLAQLETDQTWSGIQEYGAVLRLQNNIGMAFKTSGGSSINVFVAQSTDIFRILALTTTGLIKIGNSNGNIGFVFDTTNAAAKLFVGGSTSPSHFLQIAAGTTAIAPLVLTSGTSLTTAVAGAIEFTTDDFFATITTGAARKAFILDNGSRLTSGKIPVATTNGRLIDGQTPLAGTKTYYVADSSGGAVTRKLTFVDGVLTSET